MLFAACYFGFAVFFLYVLTPFCFYVVSMMVFVLFYVFAAGYDG